MTGDGFSQFMGAVLQPVRALSTQEDRILSATSTGDLTDDDLLWMVAAGLDRQGLARSPLARIVAELRYRTQHRA